MMLLYVRMPLESVLEMVYFFTTSIYSGVPKQDIDFDDANWCSAYKLAKILLNVFKDLMYVQFSYFLTK